GGAPGLALRAGGGAGGLLTLGFVQVASPDAERSRGPGRLRPSPQGRASLPRGGDGPPVNGGRARGEAWARTVRRPRRGPVRVRLAERLPLDLLVRAGAPRRPGRLGA